MDQDAAGAVQGWSASQRLGPGVRWLRSARTGECLRADGAGVAQRRCGPAPELRWMLRPTLVGGSYVIQSVATRACLTVNDRERGRAVATLRRCTYGPRQRWQATRPRGARDALTRLRSLATRACLTVTGSGGSIRTAPCSAAASQRFQLHRLHREPELLSWYQEEETEAGARPVIGYQGGSYGVFFGARQIRKISLDGRLRLTPARGFTPRLARSIKPSAYKAISSSPIAVASRGSGSSGVIGRASVEVCRKGSCSTRAFLAHVPDARSDDLILHTGEVRGAIPGPGQSWLAVGTNLGGPLDNPAARHCSLIKIGRDSQVLLRHDLRLPASVVCRRVTRVRGGFVVAATARDPRVPRHKNNPLDLELIGLDANLEVTWRRRFPSATRDVVHDLRATASGDVVAAGVSVDHAGGRERPFVLRATGKGVQRWRRATSVSWPLGKGPRNIVARQLRDGGFALLVARANATRLVRLAPDGGRDSGALLVGPALPDLELWDMTCHADDRCLVTGTTKRGSHRVIGVGELQL